MTKRLTQVYGSVAKRIFDTGFKIMAGTAARSLKERFSDMTNVKDYGAKGDGITDDRSNTSSSFTENLRFTNTYASSGTLDRQAFTPRGYFNDYDSFPTEFADPSKFIITPPHKGRNISTHLQTGKNFYLEDETGKSMFTVYKSGACTVYGHITPVSANKCDLGGNSLPMRKVVTTELNVDQIRIRKDGGMLDGVNTTVTIDGKTLTFTEGVLTHIA